MSKFQGIKLQNKWSTPPYFERVWSGM